MYTPIRSHDLIVSAYDNASALAAEALNLLAAADYQNALQSHRSELFMVEDAIERLEAALRLLRGEVPPVSDNVFGYEPVEEGDGIENVCDNLVKLVDGSACPDCGCPMPVVSASIIRHVGSFLVPEQENFNITLFCSFCFDAHSLDKHDAE